jgi:4-alpha-glucanotransferase
MATGGGGQRAAGILLPLFSLRSARDWGVGEIGAIAALSRWLAGAGHRLLQLLPIAEMSRGERSPYAGLTTFAIDPIYVSMDDVEDFVGAGGEDALPPAARARLAEARAAEGIDYDAVRAAKVSALRLAFERFHDVEWVARSDRARSLDRFREGEASWLPDYALFRAQQEQQSELPWTDWDPGLRDRTPAALAAARRVQRREILFHEYVQWIAAEQWHAARAAATAAGVRLKGDLPFMVSAYSADVWARRDEFALDVSLGAPPDAFNAEGQEWGLPVCRWDVMAETGFAWLRARAARAAALFDAFRLDHVVGFYRMYVIGGPQRRDFVPPEEAAQLVLGERLLSVIQDAARPTAVIGEDLGVVPDFVRASLTRLGIPGYRVLRWENDGPRFRDPHRYPRLSVATTGTHDTSSLRVWWEDELDDAGRRALAAVPGFTALAAPRAPAPAHDILLDGLYGAGSDLVVVPFPDAYGGRERINVPATVGPANWGYRMPGTVSELDGGAGRALADRLRALAMRHGRSA